MRTALPLDSYPDHVGLAYERWAPIGAGGRLSPGKQDQWLDSLAGQAVQPHYAHALQRWKESLNATEDDTFELVLASRMLIGHGNPSATDVGLTFHRTWGTPIIPGQALKGLLAHYVDALYGPTNPDVLPWEQLEAERQRADWQGVVWDRNGRRTSRGPGVLYRAIFGAPESEQDALMRPHGFESGATSGEVVFHDALYVPQGAHDTPFAADVLTVHQQNYYRKAGGTFPNDYDAPIPVSFLTVRPGVRFLFTLSGPADARQVASRLLQDALCGWGIGGKTSLGYGRFRRHGEPEVPSEPQAPSKLSEGPNYKRGERVSVTRIEDVKEKPKFRASDGVVGHFVEGAPTLGVGATADVWIANVAPQGYTFTMQPPKGGKKH